MSCQYIPLIHVAVEEPCFSPNRMHIDGDTDIKGIRSYSSLLGWILATFTSFAQGVDTDQGKIYCNVSSARQWAVRNGAQAMDGASVKQCIESVQATLKGTLPLSDSDCSDDSSSEEDSLAPIPHLPPGLNDSFDFYSGIPEEVQKSLATLFGIEDVVSQIPTFGLLKGKLNVKSILKKLDYPVMTYRDTHGAPGIFIKLKAAAPEPCSDDDQASDDVRSEESDPDKEFLLAFRQVFWNDSPLMWNQMATNPRKDPDFLGTTSFTYEDTGELITEAQPQAIEFHKLFSGEPATDRNGNRWVIPGYDTSE